jgi:hypothetical protein
LLPSESLLDPFQADQTTAATVWVSRHRVCDLVVQNAVCESHESPLVCQSYDLPPPLQAAAAAAQRAAATSDHSVTYQSQTKEVVDEDRKMPCTACFAFHVFDIAPQKPLLSVLDEGATRTDAPAAPSPLQAIARDLMCISDGSHIAIECPLVAEWWSGCRARR